MKKLFSYWAVVAIVLTACLSSCNKYDDDYIEASETEVTFEATGGTHPITLDANGAWTVIETPEWCTPTPLYGSSSAEIMLIAIYNDGEEREGVLRIQRGEAEATITLVQKKMTIPVINLDKKELAFTPEGGTETIKVITDGAWTVSSEVPEWCTLSDHTGEGPMDITLIVDPNEDEAPRTTTIEFSRNNNVKVALVITQAEEEAAYVTLDKEEVSFASEGGSEKIAITGNGEWYSITIPEWCRIENDPENETGEIKDEGEGRYVLTAVSNFVLIAEANESNDPREVTLTMVSSNDAEVDLTIKQEGVPEDVVSLNKEKLTFIQSGGEQKVMLTANGAWEITEIPEWCVVTPTEGEGNAEITITVQANTGMDEREVTLNIERGSKSAELIITQAAPTVTLDKNKITLVPVITQEIIRLTTIGEWSVTSQLPEWLSVSPMSGNGNTDLTIAATSKNYETTERTATITITRGSSTANLVVTQEGAGAEPYIKLDKNSVIFFGEGGSEVIGIDSNVEWSVSGTTEWCTVVPMEGNSSGSFTVSTTRNETGSERTANIKFSLGEKATATFTVTQKALTDEAPSISVSPGILEFGEESSGQKVMVTVNGPWEITQMPEWCIVEDGMSGDTSKEIYVEVTHNDGTEPREGTITFKRGEATTTLTVKQEAAYIRIVPGTITFEAEGGDIEVLVEANGEWEVVDDYDGWFWTELSGNGTLKIWTDAIENEGPERKQTVTFRRGAATATLEVIQKAAPATPEGGE